MAVNDQRVQQLRTSILRKVRVLLFTKSTQVKDEFYSLFIRLGYNGFETAHSFTMALESIKRRQALRAPFKLFIIDDQDVDADQSKKVYEFIRKSEESKTLPIAVLQGSNPITFGKEDPYLLSLSRQSKYDELLARVESFLTPLMPENYSPLVIEDRENLKSITFPVDVDSMIIDSTKDLCASAPKIFHLFSFLEVKDLSEPAIRALFHIFRGLKTQSINFASVNIKNDVLSTINSLGLLSVFNFRRSVEDAFKYANIPMPTKATPAPVGNKKTIDVRLVNPFISTIIQGLNELGGLTFTLSPPKMLAQPAHTDIKRVLGINLTGSSFEGSVCIILPSIVHTALYAHQATLGVTENAAFEKKLNSMVVEIIKKSFAFLKTKYQMSFTKVSLHFFTNSEEIKSYLKTDKLLSCTLTSSKGEAEIVIFTSTPLNSAVSNSA